jgi:hypothetical protein
MGVRAVPDSAKFELSIDFDYWKENVRSARARRRREATASTAAPGLLLGYALQLSVSRFASRKSRRKSQFISMCYVACEPQLSKVLPSELGSSKAALPTRIESIQGWR